MVYNALNLRMKRFNERIKNCEFIIMYIYFSKATTDQVIIMFCFFGLGRQNAEKKLFSLELETCHCKLPDESQMSPFTIDFCQS